MPPKHVEDLFSGAYDDALTPREAERFAAHLRECDACASAYEAFHASVDALRALPAARMPVMVHLPSTPPVAEQRAFPVRLPRAWRPQLRAGFATGIAAAAAVVLVVLAVSHQGGGGTSPGSSTALEAPSSTGGATTTPGCPAPAAASASQQLTSGFDNREVKTEPDRPGQQLVLATASDHYAPGSQVAVYSLLTAPLPAAAAANGTVAPTTSVAAVPCVRVEAASALPSQGGTAPVPAGGRAVFATPAPAAAGSGAGSSIGAGAVPGSPLTPILYFSIPPNTPSGTVLHVVATVPAGYPQPGDPAFSVDLVITVR